MLQLRNMVLDLQQATMVGARRFVKGNRRDACRSRPERYRGDLPSTGRGDGAAGLRRTA